MTILTRILPLAMLATVLYAQGSYGIQVYGSHLVDPGATMLELHSNFTFEGQKSVIDGQYPAEHQLHETLEIMHGFNDWFELGFYVFTSADDRVGWQGAGDHLRPRVAVPKSWSRPVGVSLSTRSVISAPYIRRMIPGGRVTTNRSQRHRPRARRNQFNR